MARITILEKQTLEFIYDAYYGLYMYSADAGMFLFEEGAEYHVLWDDDEYVVTATALTAYGRSALCVGNLAIAEAGDDSGEPFLLGYTTDWTNTTLIQTTETASAHTVAIYQDEEPNGIVIKNPLGESITYGEYSKICVTRADGSKAIYSIDGGGGNFDDEDENLKYFAYQLNTTEKTITIYAINTKLLFEDTGAYDITIPDTLGGYRVLIASEGMI